jgi:hypothetical protein
MEEEDKHQQEVSAAPACAEESRWRRSSSRLNNIYNCGQKVLKELIITRN